MVRQSLARVVTGARDDDVHVADHLAQLHHPEAVHAIQKPERQTRPAHLS